MIATDHDDPMLTPEQAELSTDAANARRGPLDRLRQAVMSRLFDDEPSTPQRLGRYTIERALGRGGMGTVYVAHDPQLDRKVALKVLNYTSSEEGGGRLLREAKALARLSHPNVVQVHDAGTIGDQVFLAMELVKGPDLRRWLEEPRSWMEVTDALLAAGRGLAAAHDAGLVHRDFKPENVLVRGDGVVKVADFGLVRDGSSTDPARPSEKALAADASDVLTRTGSVLGTPAYMSPEQHLGLSTDARTDQFSFCIALYEGVYGKRPFAGESLGDLIGTVARGDITFPKRPRVPAAIVRVLERGLQPDVEERYPDMHALLDDLRRARRPGRGGMKLGAAAALVGLTALGVYLGPGQAGPAVASTCDPEAKADEVWNVRVRDELAVRFGALAPRLADNATRTAHSDLDAYFQRWTEAYETTCGDGSPEAQRLARRLCLHSRFDEASGVIEVLREADGDIVASVAQITAALEPVKTCLDTRTVVHVAASDPAFSRDLVRARALWNTRQPEEALALATDLAERAKQAQDRAIEVDARLLTGMITIIDLGVMRADLDAHAELTTALEVAQVLGDPRRVLRAETLLFNFPPEGQRWPDFDALRALEPRVLATHDALAQWAFHFTLVTQLVKILPGMDQTEPQLHAKALLELSRASFGPGHRLLASAEDLARRAGILDEETPESATERAKSVEVMFGADSHAAAEAMVDRARTLTRSGEYDQGREAFEEAIEAWTALEGPDAPQVGEAWRWIATIEMTRGKIPAALAAIDAAIGAIESIPDDPDLLSDALSNRALLLLWLDRPADALVALEQAEQHRTADSTTSRDGDLAGRVRRANGDYEGALLAYDEALAGWAERAPYARVGFRSTLHLVAGKGETLLEMGRVEEARELVEPVWPALRNGRADPHYERQRARLGLVLASSLPAEDARVPAIIERSLGAIDGMDENPEVRAMRRALQALTPATQ